MLKSKKTMLRVAESTVYLCIGEVQTGDREDHLSAGHQEVLNDLPGHVDAVRLNLLYCFNGVGTLHTFREAAVLFPLSR